MSTPIPQPVDQAAVTALYEQLMHAWNRHDAHDFTAVFEEEANVVGFDGSIMNGRAEIETTLHQIFADHITAAYVWKIREVRFMSPKTAILRAVVGMIPPGKTDINPAVNAIQTMVAANREHAWQIALLQSTPAQFHGRPELAEALTQELRQLL
jgi:uncharacterized protein (TIGR02246 family)